MGIRSSIRNFFYAATHANQLVNSQQESEITIAMQSQELLKLQSYLEEANVEYSIENDRKRREREKYDQVKSVHTPLPLSTAGPVGHIDELDADGRIRDRIKFWSKKDFMYCVHGHLYLGDPVAITVYSDPKTGAHINTSWQSELRSPHQHLAVVPFDPVADLSRYVSRTQLEAEIDMRLFPRVAIESTADYTDSEFHKKTVDIDMRNKDGSFGRTVDKYRVVTISNEGCHITAITRPLNSYEAAIEAIHASPTVKQIPYEELVQEAEHRRWAKDTRRDITGYSTEQLQQAIEQLDRSKSISERPKSTQPLPNMPVARIDYLSPKGNVRESLEYQEEGEFIKDILHSGDIGEPMSITVYSDPKTGAHIDVSWRLELDPPPQGFQITPYQVPQAEALEPVPMPESEFEL